jgi:hypothetical protein
LNALPLYNNPTLLDLVAFFDQLMIADIPVDFGSIGVRDKSGRSYKKKVEPQSQEAESLIHPFALYICGYMRIE